MEKLIDLLVEKTGLKPRAIKNILQLLEDGSTIPFIARYRKEMTGGATDEDLRLFEEAYNHAKRLLIRKEEVLRLIIEKGFLTPELRRNVETAQTMTEVEDLYRPFKEKKNTRAGIAIARGLKNLADVLERGNLSLAEIRKNAESFVKGEVKNADEAIQGAMDILAERFSDDPADRERVRNFTRKTALLEIKEKKNSENTENPYARYAERAERISSIPSHRYLAIMRGSREKQISTRLAVEVEQIETTIINERLRNIKSSDSARIIFDACRDGLKRLMIPSIEREIHNELKEKSDLQAVKTFGRNLSQLLMTPPIIGRVIMGVDPAFRTGCKIAIIDENGKFLDHSIIFPTPPKNDYEGSRRVILDLAKKYNIKGVAIGNGTASRETQEFFARLNREEKVDLKYTVVSEAGASVYSASKVGQDEYPDMDVTVRGAISIAQRLRDPMAALVKIDPVSLGIGQYQHDVDKKLLERKLYETIEDLVNRVGVDVNSASPSLLSYVAGVGPKLARSIVSYRESKGPFNSKKDLLKVPGMGQKAFEQCAGFIRIRDGKSILDNTGIHPESYKIAEKLLDQKSLAALMAEYKRPAGSRTFTEIGDLRNEHIKYLAQKLDTGLETLADIVKELQKPGFDPREDLPEIPFRDDITDIQQLKEGSIVSGVVRNITDFGAFVDIGLKNDGLIHISEMSENRITHPMEALSLNQYLPSIRVIGTDPEKGKVSLSLKGF